MLFSQQHLAACPRCQPAANGRLRGCRPAAVIMLCPGKNNVYFCVCSVACHPLSWWAGVAERTGRPGRDPGRKGVDEVPHRSGPTAGRRRRMPRIPAISPTKNPIRVRCPTVAAVAANWDFPPTETGTETVPRSARGQRRVAEAEGQTQRIGTWKPTKGAPPCAEISMAGLRPRPKV